MRRVAPLALILALAACTSDTPKPAASGTPTPSATPASAAAPSLVVAITRQDGKGMELYRIDAQRRARRLRTIAPPEGFASLWEVALSAGPEPRVCGLWVDSTPGTDASGDELVCDGVGVLATDESGDLDGIALDPAGGRALWSSYQGDEKTVLTLAELGKDAVGRRQTFLMDCPRYLKGAAWGDASHVVLHCSTGDSDDPGRLAWQQLGESPPPADDIPMLPTTPRGYDLMLYPAGYVDGGVLAVQRVDCLDGCPVKLPQRAVRVDPRTGKVLEVVASPAKGREVASVSGGAHGVVYATYADADGGLRVYLRWPGERHDTPVTGLPADVSTVVAQP